jgi:hypothetical protein
LKQQQIERLEERIDVDKEEQRKQQERIHTLSHELKTIQLKSIEYEVS